MRFILHTFRASETIDAVIRLLGRHNYSPDEMVVMRRAFDQLNGKIVPKPGMQYKIPTPLETIDEFGNVVSTADRVSEVENCVPSATPGDTGSHEQASVMNSASVSEIQPPQAPSGAVAPEVHAAKMTLSDAEAKLASAQAKLAALRAARSSRIMS